MTELPSSHYVRILRPLLPTEAFAPHAGILWTAAFHLLVIVAGIITVATAGLSWPWLLLLSGVIGHSMTGMAFVGHEVLHGSVLRSRRWSYAIGSVCLTPFILSPRLWKAWHNQRHHGHTMENGVDPDAYPMLDAYRAQRSLRMMDRVALGHRRWLGWVGMLIGFTGQSTQILFNARKTGLIREGEQKWVIAETLASLGFWIVVGALVGPKAFLFSFVFPMMAANVVAMSYILTNHHLSPLTTINDPLLNSLTVTVPRFWEVLHSRFGLHVEHHLFPAMSSHHAKKVRSLLQQHWPERYQSMSLVSAVWRLWKTPRVYRKPTELFDPVHGHSVPTLLPRTNPPPSTLPFPERPATTPAPALNL